MAIMLRNPEDSFFGVIFKSGTNILIEHTVCDLALFWNPMSEVRYQKILCNNIMLLDLWEKILTCIRYVSVHLTRSNWFIPISGAVAATAIWAECSQR